jgi:hypothetical protein
VLSVNHKSNKQRPSEIGKELEKQTQRLKNARLLMLDSELISMDTRK